MAVPTTRNIDDSVRADQHPITAQNDCLMQEAACGILAQALRVAQEQLPFGQQMRQQLASLGEFDIPPRNPVRASWRAGRSRATT